MSLGVFDPNVFDSNVFDTPPQATTGGGWIDPRVARELLRRARALQKAQEDHAKDRRAEIERRRQSLQDSLQNAYAQITGEELPVKPEQIAETIAKAEAVTPSQQVANAIAVYVAVMSIGDSTAMDQAIDALDMAFLQARRDMLAADDEEVLLLTAY